MTLAHLDVFDLLHYLNLFISSICRLSKLISYMGHYTYHCDGCFVRRIFDLDYLEDIGHHAAETRMRSIQRGKEEGRMGNG